MSGVAILIPAAGRSARMRGRDKLLEPVEGRPLIRRQAELALATGAPVMVTLPPGNPERVAALAGLDGLRITCLADAGEGIAASIRAGGAWAERINARGLMILLADLPDLRIGDLCALRDAFDAAPDTALRAGDDTGRPGHPVILPRAMFEHLHGLSGDRGAGALLAGGRCAVISLPGARASTDLDTPEDWADWRARRGQRGN